jgi:hypothetical protein
MWQCQKGEASVLDIERQYFDQHQEELLRQCPGKFAVIRSEHVIGSFDNLKQALSAGAQQFGLSSLLVRRTDEQPREVSIPALTLGILRAPSSVPTGGSGTNT